MPIRFNWTVARRQDIWPDEDMPETIFICNDRETPIASVDTHTDDNINLQYANMIVNAVNRTGPFAR